VLSHILSELVVVHEWLYDAAPPPPWLDASTGYWRFEKHRVDAGTVDGEHRSRGGEHCA
jgi:nuclear pore complex protein Nup107